MKGTNCGSGGTTRTLCSGFSGYLIERPRFLDIWSEESAAVAGAVAASGVLKGRPLFFAIDCVRGVAWEFLKERPRFLLVVGVSNVSLASVFSGRDPMTIENVETRDWSCNMWSWR